MANFNDNYYSKQTVDMTSLKRKITLLGCDKLVKFTYWPIAKFFLCLH